MDDSEESKIAEKALKAQRKAEKRIKELMMLALVSLLSANFLEDEISKAIKDMKDELPPSADYASLANGLWRFAMEAGRFVSQTKSALDSIRASVPELPKNPLKAIEFIEKKKIPDALTTAEIQKLPKKVKDGVSVMAGKEPQAEVAGATRPISEWSAVETQVRHDFQKKKIDEAFAKGGDLFRISVHRNCSERCFPDQGKVISKTLPAKDGLWTGEKTPSGEKIYSYQAMIARTDSYGYHNFILTGFNCRHFLEPYEDGKPAKPTKMEAEEVSEAENKMRYMERRLRAIKSKAELMKKVDPILSKKSSDEWDRGIKEYEAFANKWGLEPQEWRAI